MRLAKKRFWHHGFSTQAMGAAFNRKRVARAELVIEMECCFDGV